MIIFKGVKDANKTISFIEFSNETGKIVSIPVPRNIANLISFHLRYLSSAPEVPETGNLEIHD